MLLLRQSNFSNWRKHFYEKTLQRVTESGAYYVLTVCALASCFYIVWLTPFSLTHSLSPNVSWFVLIAAGEAAQIFSLRFWCIVMLTHFLGATDFFFKCFHSICIKLTLFTLLINSLYIEIETKGFKWSGYQFFLLFIPTQVQQFLIKIQTSLHFFDV